MRTAVPVSVCTPSRFALLTGQYHWRRFFSIVRGFDSPRFVDEDLTLPDMFKGRGVHNDYAGRLKRRTGDQVEGCKKSLDIYLKMI